MPASHLLCYVRRRRLTDWKIDSLKRGATGPPVIAYGSGAPAFLRYAKRGSVLWIVGARDNGTLSLEAKIKVAGSIRRDKEWPIVVRGAQNGSAFFGLNDASDVVMRLVFANSKSLWSLQRKYRSTRWKPMYGRELQSPRRIASPIEGLGRLRSSGAAELERLASRAIDRSIFLSWKHCDHNQTNPSFIRELVNELTTRGFFVWWDRTALTDVRGLPEYKGPRKDRMLSRLLQQGLVGTKSILALWTKRYGTTVGTGQNWTKREWQTRGVTRIALTSGTFEIKPGLAEPHHIIQTPHFNDAAAVARRFKRLFDAIYS